MNGPIYVTFTVPPGQSAIGVYEDESGVPVVVVDSPVLIASGLQQPMPVFDAGAPVFQDEMGHAQVSLAVMGLSAPSINWNWQPFTLTPADTGDWIGYTNGDLASPPFNPPEGSISNEPTAVTNLEAMYYDTDGKVVAVFSGDFVGELGDLTATINGVQIDATDVYSQWGATWVEFTDYPSGFVVGQEYAVEFGAVAESVMIRAATPVAAVANYNGHSLIDTATWNPNEDGYTWMHAVYEDLIGDMLDPATPPGITRTSIPGSSTQWRWDHPDGGGYNARANMADIDLLVMAEGGPHWITRIADGEEDPLREGFVNIIAGQRNWVDLADSNGADVIYYQIWPALDGWSGEPYVDRDWTFEQWVTEYDRVAKFTADYWSHHLGRQVYVCPGHRLYARIKLDIDADMVPGAEAIEDLYPEGDPIHPSKVGAWPMRLMLAAMIYKVDPASVTISRPPYITESYHDYCCGLAWGVLQDYALAGFGGPDWGTGDGYTHGTTADPLNPPDPPEPEPGDLPEFMLAATPDGYTGPVLSGSPTSAGAPIWTGDAWSIDGAVTAALSRTGPVFCCAVIRLADVPSPPVRGPMVILQSNATWWQGDLYALMFNGYIGDGVYQTDQSGGVGGPANLGSASTDYALVWWYNDGSASGGGSGSSGADAIDAPAVPATNYLTIGGNLDGTPDIELRGLWIWPPDEGQEADQLDAVRALAATYLPGG